MIAYRSRRRLREVDWVVDFVPRLGYTWQIVERGIVLWDSVAATEFTALAQIREKFVDFGMDVPDDL